MARLGDKLDAAERADDDAWVTLFFEYEPLAVATALATKQPKIKIKTTADYWRADTQWSALHDRARAIQANIASVAAAMRTNADLKAQLAVVERDIRIYWAALTEYRNNKNATKAKAIGIAKARRARVHALAKAIMESAS